MRVSFSIVFALRERAFHLDLFLPKDIVGKYAKCECSTNKNNITVRGAVADAPLKFVTASGRLKVTRATIQRPIESDVRFTTIAPFLHFFLFL